MEEKDRYKELMTYEGNTVYLDIKDNSIVLELNNTYLRSPTIDERRELCNRGLEKKILEIFDNQLINYSEVKRK